MSTNVSGDPLAINASPALRTHAAGPVPHATVPAMYRSGDDVRQLLEEISTEPPADATRRRQVIDILDDLAEELIGRGQEGDRALRVQIRRMREDLPHAAPFMEPDRP
ncbi:hypothetical protein ABIB25_001047 [Nakamurella sp. UYEF19]|uniref:hypothetical protein n=1 Tax=Nakamurella sp. UYEF19 TaxID=1756392 RepID=UPI003394A4F1